MKTNLFYISLLALAALSCTKENPKMSPGTFQIIPFDVKTSSLEFKAGETVKFQLEGNADTVYFYSGEFGKDYNYIGGREVLIENPTLTIHTGSSYGHQPSLSILLSQDFNGDYTMPNILAATWKDMTSKFEIPTPVYVSSKPNTVQKSISPAVDISEFIEGDTPYYIAVRNKLVANSPGANTTQWYFYNSDFKFEGRAGGIPIDIFTFENAGWTSANSGYTGTRAEMPYLTPDPPAVPTSLFFGRNVPSADAMDSWGITMVIPQKVAIGGDKGTLIKRDTDLPLETYTHVYNTPGEYDVTFYGGNRDKTKKLIQLKITVTP